MARRESLFLEATPRPWVIALCKLAIGPLMRVYYRIRSVSFSKQDALKYEPVRTERVVFVSNHVDRRDAVAAFYLSKALKDRFYFLSNREQLEERTLYTWLLRSCGVYSIARGMADVSSIKYTTRLLTADEPNKVFLFPEGGAFSRNDSVFPFLIQPFEMLRRCDALLKKRLPDRSLWIIPVAMRYEYRNVEKEIESSVRGLERAVGMENARGDAATRLLAVGKKVAASFDRMFDVEMEQDADVHEQGRSIKRYLVDSLAGQMQLMGVAHERRPSASDDDKERARDVLNELYARHSKLRVSEDILPESEYERRLRAQIFRRLNRVFDEARRLENWIALDADYFREGATTNRVIDAIIRLEREVFGDVRWSAERECVILLGDAMDVGAYDSAEILANVCRDRISGMLRDA